MEGDEATRQTVDNMIEWACTKAPNGDIDCRSYRCVSFRILCILFRMHEASMQEMHVP